MERVGIGLIGLGTVGGSVARILDAFGERIGQRAGVELYVKRAVVRDVAKYGEFSFEVTEDLDALLDDDEISIVVELIGGIEYPFEIAKRVFARKKAFVTANKAMLAYHAQELLECSEGIPFGFEASVCGGIPIVEILRDSLVANEFEGFEGILNGTSNFILSKMIQDKYEFDEALQMAQKLGYAEADPSLDINGGDAGHKLLILARLAYGINATPEEILIEGIESVGLEDMCFADELGYVIKLVGIVKKEEDTLDVRLHPALVHKDKELAQVHGVKNAILLHGDCVGELFVSGFGAGGDVTASAVIADLVQVARLRNTGTCPYPPFGFFKIPQALRLKPREEIESAYYLRFVVRDEYGVLAKITASLAHFGISVNQILQKSSNEKAKIILITHKIQEHKIDLALDQIVTEGLLLQSPYKIRIQ
ncbi:homoserine dehydrogenase [Helicobacter pametensis]|uniref:homoserine dehydrogenase n=1 Tax=Helicobacter pametensis TaxID=95149 RepID=UPI0004874568|nr:homoserine dehydrogenase [Helicobacter pametensis]